MQTLFGIIKVLLFVTLQFIPFSIMVRIIQIARGYKIKMKTGRLLKSSGFNYRDEQKVSIVYDLLPAQTACAASRDQDEVKVRHLILYKKQQHFDTFCFKFIYIYLLLLYIIIITTLHIARGASTDKITCYLDVGH